MTTKIAHYAIGATVIISMVVLICVGKVSATAGVGVIIGVAGPLIGSGISVAGAQSAPTTVVTTTTSAPAATTVTGQRVTQPLPLRP